MKIVFLFYLLIFARKKKNGTSLLGASPVESENPKSAIAKKLRLRRESVRTVPLSSSEPRKDR